MKVYRLDAMVKGWFVGDFEPAVLRTRACEVAVKAYEAGDVEHAHYHAVATEITLIHAGKANLNGVELVDGDIVVIEPGETAEFVALTDVTTIVVKMPSVKGDKFRGAAK